MASIVAEEPFDTHMEAVQWVKRKASAQGKSVRITASKPPLVSIIDVISVLCQCNNVVASSRFSYLIRSKKMRILSLIKYTFPKYKRAITPVVSAEGCVTIVHAIVAGYPLVDQFKELCRKFMGVRVAVAATVSMTIADVAAVPAHPVKTPEAEDWRIIAQTLHRKHNEELEALKSENCALETSN